jgi:hypothetical protein
MIVTMKNTIFWDMTPCTLVEVYWCFREMYCLHLQNPRVCGRGSTCSCVATTHNTQVKIISEFIEDMKKFCLKTGKRFPTKIYLQPGKWMVAVLDNYCLKESLLTNYMKQIFLRRSQLLNQSRNLWNLKVHYHAHKSSSPMPISEPDEFSPYPEILSSSRSILLLFYPYISLWRKYFLFSD